MPVPCRYCGCLLDSYSDHCGCPEEVEARALPAKAEEQEAKEAEAVQAQPLPKGRTHT